MEAQAFGKTTFISILSKLIPKKKILIIDFDLINNNLHSVFGVKQISKEMKEKIKDHEFLNEFRLKESNIKKLKVRIDRNIELISKTKIIFDKKYIVKEERIRIMLEELTKNYDLILIDTSSDTKYRELVKILTALSNKVICLIEGNIISIRKTMNLLKEFEEQRSKIKLVYNKKSKYTLSTSILKIIFLKFKLIGTLEYEIEYNISENRRNSNRSKE